MYVINNMIFKLYSATSFAVHYSVRVVTVVTYSVKWIRMCVCVCVSVFLCEQLIH